MNPTGEKASVKESPVSSVRSRLEIADDILKTNGIEGRGADMISLGIVSSSQESRCRFLSKGESLDLSTDTSRYLIEQGLHLAHSGSDALWPNHDMWRNTYLDHDWLNNATMGDRERFLADAQVAFLMEACNFGSWGKVSGEAYAQTVDTGLETALQDVAHQAIAAKDWQELQIVAAGFAQSPVADQIHRVAEKWYEQHTTSVSSRSGEAVDGILVAYETIKKPDAVMACVKRVCLDAFGVDLDQVKELMNPPAERPSTETPIAPATEVPRPPTPQEPVSI